MAAKVEKIQPLAYYRGKRESAVSVARGESAASAIGRLSKSDGFTIITNGAFSMIDAICHVLSETGPAHILVTTWIPGTQEIVDLCDLRDDRKVLGLKVLVDYGFAGNKPDRARFLAEKIGSRNIVETRNHSKIAMVRNSEWGFVLRGSLNLNGNFRAENLDGDNLPSFCDQISGWFESLAARGSGLFLPGSEVYKNYVATMSERDTSRLAGEDRELSRSAMRRRES